MADHQRRLSERQARAEEFRDELLEVESKMDQYEEVEMIGRGAFGTAHKVRARYQSRGVEYYVMKKVNMTIASEKERVTVENEVKLLKELHHPYVVKYYDSFTHTVTGHDGTDCKILCIVMEYCSNGDLATMLKKSKDDPLPEEKILEWFMQLVVALQYVHSKRILHRDLKTQNIFITKENNLRLGDFGIARVLEDSQELAQTIIGTPYYMSPECCQGKKYNAKSDVWALGCVLYELCARKHAFEANSIISLAWQIVEGNYPPIPDIYSKGMNNLVSLLLSRDPIERPKLSEIKDLEVMRPYLYLCAGKGSDSRPGLNITVPPSMYGESAETEQKKESAAAAKADAEATEEKRRPSTREEVLRRKEQKLKEQQEAYMKQLAQVRQETANERKEARMRRNSEFTPTGSEAMAFTSGSGRSPLSDVQTPQRQNRDGRSPSTDYGRGRPGLPATPVTPATPATPMTPYVGREYYEERQHEPYSGPSSSARVNHDERPITGHKTFEDEFYEDDFEDDFESDEEVPAAPKSQAQQPKPQSFTDRILQSLKTEAIKVLGEECFDNVYYFLQQQQDDEFYPPQTDYERKRLKHDLIKMVGGRLYPHCQLVEQVIYRESFSSEGK